MCYVSRWKYVATGTWNNTPLLEPLPVLDVFDTVWISRKLHSFRIVIEGGVMFSAVIPPVSTSSFRALLKLALSFFASDPVEAADHSLKFPGNNSGIHYSRCVWIVSLDGWFWLGGFHFFQCVSHCYHFLGCNEKCPQFCFWNREHDEFNNLGKSENWAVPSLHGIVFGKKILSSCSAAAFAFVVKSCVRMCTQNHVSGAIEYPIRGVCSTVIKYLTDCFFGVFCCGSLLVSNGTKAGK